MMTKAQSEKLVQAFAIYKAASKPGSGASMAIQQKLYAKYDALLTKALDAAGMRAAPQSFLDELDDRATAWLRTQAIQGPGRWW